MLNADWFERLLSLVCEQFKEGGDAFLEILSGQSMLVRYTGTLGRCGAATPRQPSFSL